MKNDLKVICFYTPNGIYPTMAERMQKSCEENNIQYLIEKSEDLGSWVKNCGYKAKFILEKLKCVNDNQCLLWIDSDAVIKKTPSLLYSCKEDFAIHARPGGKTITPAGRETINLPAKWTLEPKWFESGTIFLRKTDKCLQMLNIWNELTANGNKWDQWTLQEAWAEVQPPTLWLPRSYCQIHRLHGDKDAVVLHDLASTIQKVNRL